MKQQVKSHAVGYFGKFHPMHKTYSQKKNVWGAHILDLNHHESWSVANSANHNSNPRVTLETCAQKSRTQAYPNHWATV